MRRLALRRELSIACAGAGKSTKIIRDAWNLSQKNIPSLITTYTESNQRELKKKFEEEYGYLPSNINIKGWYSFLLEDLIRPYQKVLPQLSNRLQGLNFNKAGDPHKKSGRNIPGTGEKKNFVRHFTVSKGTKVHSFYISKLACRIMQASGKAPAKRLATIYGAIFVDEVQDLTGWDYEVLSHISKCPILECHALGDFRQTIYETSKGSKQPKTSLQKRSKFEELNFKEIPMSGSRRCSQVICDISDLVHAGEGYEKTTCIVDRDKFPLPDHVGVFTLSNLNAPAYIEKFQPVILKRDKNTEIELCNGYQSYNFGIAKGLQFDRVMIIPTEAQKEFLMGNSKPLNNGKTDKAKNQFYVALTRARFSVAILMDEESSLNNVSRYSADTKRGTVTTAVSTLEKFL